MEEEKTYEEFIQNILDTRGRFHCGDEYHEKHHILPKCMGGGNDENNLIDLYAREHFIAHKLLALENPENEKLVYAWWCMAHIKTNNHYELTEQEYEEARISFSKSTSGINSPHYGKHLSEDRKMNLSEKAKKRYENPENHPMYGKHMREDTKKRLSEIQKERFSNPENNPMYGKNHTKESKQKISDKSKERFSSPKNNPMYGKHHTEEAKRKNREKHLGKHPSEETRKKMRQNHADQRGANSVLSKAVVQCTNEIDFIKLWDSSRDAERVCGFDHSKINKCCNHKAHTAYGYIWMLKEEYDELCNYPYEERKEIYETISQIKRSNEI